MDGPESKLHVTRSRRATLVLFGIGYVVLAGGYLLLVRQESRVWETKRQKRIEEAPVVWVAPFGKHYHQEHHYGRYLSAQLSLYEATERGYEHCSICNPPVPAELLQSPFWVSHWLVTLLMLSGTWLVVTVVVVHKSRGRGKRFAADSDEH